MSPLDTPRGASWAIRLLAFCEQKDEKKLGDMLHFLWTETCKSFKQKTFLW